MDLAGNAAGEHAPTVAQIQDALRNAVETTLDRDFDLVALGAHEQAIAHRIAFYLESSFPTYHTDCEYNRRNHLTKRQQPSSVSNRKNMRPDILIHRRNKSVNLLAVEMKARSNPQTHDDCRKLKYLMIQQAYRYATAAFVRILNRKSDIRWGTLNASILWYEVKHGRLAVSHTVNVESTVHSDDVIAIYRKRR